MFYFLKKENEPPALLDLVQLDCSLLCNTPPMVSCPTGRATDAEH
jgi:hypothetical protein